MSPKQSFLLTFSKYPKLWIFKYSPILSTMFAFSKWEVQLYLTTGSWFFLPLLKSCKINRNCVSLLKPIFKFQGCACKFLYGPGTDEDKKEELEKVENQQTYHTVMVRSPWWRCTLIFLIGVFLTTGPGGQRWAADGSSALQKEWWVAGFWFPLLLKVIFKLSWMLYLCCSLISHFQNVFAI